MMSAWRWLVHDIWWKLASLGLAALVWGVVSAEPEIETVMTVPVQYANRAPDLEVGSDYPQTIRLELRGSSGRLRDLNAVKTAAVLDFSDVHAPGERTFPITHRNAGLPRGVQLVRAVPSTLHFVFERTVTRIVPVQVRLSGQLPGGGIPLVQASPSQVTIAGPEARVREVKSVVTDPVDLKSIHGATRRTAAIYTTEPEVRLLGHPEVQVSIVIKQ
jgi:YbbR domain-containing protein